MSQHASTAARANLTVAQLDDLIRGSVHANVAAKLRLTIADVESFITGHPSAAVAGRLSVGTVAATAALAHALGPQGAAGLIVGLLFCIEQQEEAARKSR